MKRFLLKIVLFILPVIILAYSMDYIVTEGLKKTRYSDFAEWNELFEGRINADIIISGSSLAWTQISPRIVDEKTGCNSFNLGMDGSSFHSQYYRYFAYETYNKKPKVIIQTIDVGTLKKTENLFNYQQFLPYLDDKSVETEVYSYNGFTRKNNFIPFQRYFGEYKLAAIGITEYFNIKKFSNNKYKGYLGKETKINYSGLESFLKSGKKLTIPYDDASIKLFEAFLKHCKEAGIKLILVLPPMYIENQSVINNYDQVFNIYNTLAKKYDTPLLQYQDRPIALRKEIFNDGVHLNKTGAELFSETLLDELLNNHELEPCTTTLK